MNSKLKSLDIYGQQINLTYKGDDTFKTTPGAVMSLIIIILLVGYASFRAYVLLEKKDPNISKSSFMRNLKTEPEYRP